jgi:tetratricopeptide (TPR) repeat protein
LTLSTTICGQPELGNAQGSDCSAALWALAVLLVRGYLSEGRYWLQVVLEQSEGMPAAMQAATFHAAGRLAMEQRDLDSAENFFQESLAIKRALTDRMGEAAVLNSLGSVAWYRGDRQRAKALYEQVLALRRDLMTRKE